MTFLIIRDKKIKGGNLPPLIKMHFQTIFINEMGIYELIFQSKMPLATQFKKWVFSEVLPQIRKKGEYKRNEIVKPNLTFNIQTELDLHKQIINFIKVKFPHILLIVRTSK